MKASQNARKLLSTDLVNNVRMLTSERHFTCAGEDKGRESKTERESLGVGRDM